MTAGDKVAQRVMASSIILTYVSSNDPDFAQQGPTGAHLIKT